MRQVTSRAKVCNFIKKESLAQVFCCELRVISSLMAPSVLTLPKNSQILSGSLEKNIITDNLMHPLTYGITHLDKKR